jgi:hypothetical protein
MMTDDCMAWQNNMESALFKHDFGFEQKDMICALGIFFER